MKWVIRSQAPKCDICIIMLAHGEGSETRWKWVNNDGVSNLNWLKV
jgi:hypothetical protein